MPSTEPNIRATPWFSRVIKKLNKNEKRILDQAVKEIIGNPEIGVLKKGNLAGIRVHKFKINKQEQLLGYKESADEILLVMLGSHENYYRELGKYIE